MICGSFFGFSEVYKLGFAELFYGDIPRPGACHFALGGKVTKTPLKPLRFQPSRLK